MTIAASASSAALAASTPTTSTTDRAALHKAAQGFEAIFTRQMLGAARQTNFGDTLWGDDQGNDTFSAMRDEHFADLAAQTGTLGLAQQIEHQLAPVAAAAHAVANLFTPKA